MQQKEPGGHIRDDIDSSIIELFVSPIGNDRWSGLLPEPNQSNTDGPLKTPCEARNRVRLYISPPPYYNEPWKRQKIPLQAKVWLRGGRYEFSRPLTFDSRDVIPVTFAAWKDEQPIFDGGRKLVNWQVIQMEGRTVWVSELARAHRETWNFKSLFVNDGRRSRARLPKTGWKQIVGTPEGIDGDSFAGGSDSFICADGDFNPKWKNITDVEVVVLHLWADEHMPVTHYDEEQRLVKCSRRSMFGLGDVFGSGSSKYYIENIFEALTEPGEWYLDRLQGKVFYIPLPNETLETSDIYAPTLQELVRVEGSLRVQNIRFFGITFQHTDAALPEGGFDESANISELQDDIWPRSINYASSAQAASNLPAAITFRNASVCSIERCTIKHLGGYAIELGYGTRAIQIIKNEIHDIGGGGVKINGSESSEAKDNHSAYHLVDENHLYLLGRVFHQGVGIFLQHTYGNQISRNRLHDLCYTAISCGWTWGYAESVSRDNVIEFNHVHDIGGELLSDLGAIYLLGVQPGTVVRGNTVHDIRHAEYGGWGIYLDEGSSHIVVEKNIVYRASSHLFYLHVGRENIVRDNIFAFGGEGIVNIGRDGAALHQMTFERNILLSSGQPIFCGGYASDLCGAFTSDVNCLWDTKGEPIIASIVRDGFARNINFVEWRKRGFDLNSAITDPEFRDPENGDFKRIGDLPTRVIGDSMSC